MKADEKDYCKAIFTMGLSMRYRALRFIYFFFFFVVIVVAWGLVFDYFDVLQLLGLIDEFKKTRAPL